jgi:hypothetical protein
MSAYPVAVAPPNRWSGLIGRAAEERQQHRHAAAPWLLDNGGEHYAAAEKLRFNRALVQRHRIGNIRCS